MLCKSEAKNEPETIVGRDPCDDMRDVVGRAENWNSGTAYECGVGAGML